MHNISLDQQINPEFFDELPHFLSRREIKIRSKKKSQVKKQELTAKPLSLKQIHPLTTNQELTFEAFDDNKNLLLHGLAGTGKTFIALYLALEAVHEGRVPKPITILRSVVPSRDMGFLPGKMEEKIAVYEEPYVALCAELTGKATAYDWMKAHGYIQFSTTSYLRGMTFHNSIIIVDECQNMNFSELDTIMTRVGEGCRVIFCGDFRQTDLKNDERTGLHKFMKVLHKMKSFKTIEFGEDDIVRSGLVKEYLLTKIEEGIV